MYIDVVVKCQNLIADIFESLISPANGGANVKDKPAVYCGETVLSFREINTKANLLGTCLVLSQTSITRLCIL